MTPSPRRFGRLLPVLYLLVVGTISAAYGVVHMNMADGWGIGEWLTNYSGGFVRRGLPGAAVLFVHHATGLGLPLLVLTLQLAVYLLLLVSVALLVRGVDWTFPLLALFLSPATLAFMVLDPPSSFKKEILLFAAVAGLLVLLQRTRPPAWQLSLLLSLAAVALVLSHEALICFLPFLAAPVVLTHGLRRAAPLLVPPAVLGLAAGIAAAQHPGTLHTAQAICTSIGGSLPEFGHDPKSLCGGSIVWLTQTLEQAHATVRAAVRDYHYFRLYVPLGLLAVVPALFALRGLVRTGHRKQAITIGACAALAFAASLVVYASGLDWGRWIHIEAMGLLLLLLSVAPRQAIAPRQAVAPARQAASPLRSKLAWVVLTLYATCWTLPAVPIYPARLGYFDLFRYLTGYAKNHPAADTPGS